MAETLSARLDQDQIDDLETMADGEELESISEALRMAVNRGLESYGYRNGSPDWLEWFVGQLGTIFAALSIGWLAATFYFPVEFRTPALAFIVLSLVFFGIRAILRRTQAGRSSGWLSWRGGRA